MIKKPPIVSVALAADDLVHSLEGLGYGTRIERSSASNSSLYVYVFIGDEHGEVKVRISNHAIGKGYMFRHRKHDCELLLPNGRVSHVVAEVAALLRKRKTA